MKVRVFRIGVFHVENGDWHDEDEVTQTNHQNRPRHLEVARVDLTPIFVTVETKTTSQKSIHKNSVKLAFSIRPRKARPF